MGIFSSKFTYNGIEYKLSGFERFLRIGLFIFQTIAVVVLALILGWISLWVPPLWPIIYFVMLFMFLYKYVVPLNYYQLYRDLTFRDIYVRRKKNKK